MTYWKGFHLFFSAIFKYWLTDLRLIDFFEEVYFVFFFDFDLEFDFCDLISFPYRERFYLGPILSRISYFYVAWL
jgi:hypothetical protein